jgi:predicted transposase/invertase (TIGR01784 family)
MEEKKKFMSVADQLREEGRQEGLREVREERLKQGESKVTKEIAKRMLHLNMDREIIITATGLSEETIKELEKDLS